MGRRTSLAALAGEEVEEIPGQNALTLLRIPLGQLVPTRFNPRKNFGTEEELLEFGAVLKKRQLQPAVVVSRSAYLKLWPDETEHVDRAAYVIANGERRYRASLAAGLTHLDVVHREEVASSKAVFLDAVLSENLDRKNLDPIEQATGIETMVSELDSARAVAEYYQRSEGWVSQQRGLLDLTPALQELARTREMPIRIARDICNLPPEEQEAAWEVERQKREEAKATPRKRRKSTEARVNAAEKSAPETKAVTQAGPQTAAGRPDSADTFTAVKAESPPPTAAADADPAMGRGEPNFTAVKTGPVGPDTQAAAQPAAPAAPGDGKQSAEEPAPYAGMLPWGSPDAIRAILRQHMAREDVQTLAKILLSEG